MRKIKKKGRASYFVLPNVVMRKLSSVVTSKDFEVEVDNIERKVIISGNFLESGSASP